jgi:hypothetical protein
MKHATCIVGVFRTLLIAAAVGLDEAVLDVFTGMVKQFHHFEESLLVY